MEALKRWARGPTSRAWGPILVAVGVGAAVFWEVRAGLSARRHDMADPRYLVAARDLRAGLAVSLSDLSFRFAEKETPVPQGALTDQDLHLIADSEWARPLKAGEWISWSALGPATSKGVGAFVPRGMRAHGIEVPAGPRVFAKDEVDVFWRPKNESDTPQLLVEGARVLQVQRRGEHQTLVLAVDPDDIPVLEKAGGSGTLSLSVRNPEEGVGRPGRRRRARLRKVPPRRVEIWTEKP
jgi:Flp pilus assembly protein CpaB